MSKLVPLRNVESCLRVLLSLLGRVSIDRRNIVGSNLDHLTFKAVNALCFNQFEPVLISDSRRFFANDTADCKQDSY